MAFSSFRLSIVFILISAANLSAQPGNLIWGTWTGGTLNNGTILNYNIGTNVVNKDFDLYRTHMGYYPLGGSLTVGPDSMIYGTTSSGTFFDRGNIFKYNPYDSVYTEIYEFKPSDPVWSPCNDLYIDSSFVIYGVSYYGGTHGSIYKFNLNTNTLNVLHQFNGLDGSYPLSGLTKASNGLLYGVTSEGGISDFGVIYSFNPANNSFSVLYHFNNAGALSKLIEYSPGVLYGLTPQGGSFSNGEIFKFNVTTNTFSSLYSFNTSTGTRPNASLTIGSSGLLYGTTSGGGLNSQGTIFSFNTSVIQLTVLHHFNGVSMVQSGLCEGAPGVFYGSSAAAQGTLDGIIYKFETSSGLVTPIYTIYDDLDATLDENVFIKHPNNRLYGYRSYAYYSKPAANGAVFSIDPVADTINREFIFNQHPMGSATHGSYLAASDGNLYGINDYAQYYFDKYLVKYTPSADTMEVLHTFQDRDPGNQNTYLSGNLIEKNGVIWGCIGRSDSFPDGAVFTYDIQLGTYNEVINFDTISNFRIPRYFQMGADGNFYGLCYHKTNSITYLYRLNPLTLLFDTLLQYGVNPIIGGNSRGDISFNLARTKFSGMSLSFGINNIGTLFVYDIIGDSLTFVINLTDSNMFSYSRRYHHLINDSIIIGINSDPFNNIGPGLIWKLNLLDTTISNIYNFPSTATLHYDEYISDTDNYNLMSDGNLYGIVNISQNDVLMRINPITENVTALNTISFQKGHYPGGKLIELPFVTGIENMSSPSSVLNLYPNPCDDFIVLKGTIKHKSVYIYDINGRVIREMFSDDINTRINTSTLKQGFYLIRYYDGKKYSSLKFIKN